MTRSITRRTLLATTAIAVPTVTLASCQSGGDESESQEKLKEPDDNLNAEGMPIVDEQITLKMMTAWSPSTAEDWNEVASMKTMEELSNVHIDWGFVPWEGREEKRNLALASGDYPEILHRTALEATDIAKYGEQGVFLALNDAIEEHMPNLSAILEEFPDIRKGLTMPDGNIYSMPTIYDPAFDEVNMQHQLWVRQDWLDAFGMDLPETLDEFEAYLQKVKDGDPNGNGKADEIPYATANPSQFVQLLYSAFGLANRGLSAGPIDADESGNLRFWRTSEGYRELLEYLHKLYSQGLIQEDIFSIEASKFKDIGSKDAYGAVGSEEPSREFGAEVGDNYVALKPLKKSDGDQVPSWNMIYSPLKMIGQFVITDKAEHPAVACRWMDYFFGDEGSRLFFMGVEGESYEKTDDGYKLKDEISNNPDGLSIGEAIRPYATYGGGSYAGYVKEGYLEITEQAKTGTATVSPFRAKEVWPVFTFTPEEASELSSIMVDMDKLIEEYQANCITGAMDISADWDAFVSKLEQIGLERYMEIQQAAYDRFIE